MSRKTTDGRELRDKVDALDPAAAPMDTDAEAAGTPQPVPGSAADREQAEAAEDGKSRAADRRNKETR